ncbi:hypothetical protein MFLAVUS_003676 [Mucor flavus]|uniref:Uncharacterized protein n=1 Tax=Mucor flavus TaxID=439312 RepID=A0ABP9YTS1_9FUNG
MTYQLLNSEIYEEKSIAFPDRLPVTLEVEVYESTDLIEKDDTIAKFDYRTKPARRSTSK